MDYKEIYRGVNIYRVTRNCAGIRYLAKAVNGDRCMSDTLKGMKQLILSKEVIGHNY